MSFGYPMVICSYSRFEHLKERLKKREVHADRNCPNREWFYWNRKNEMRTVDEMGIYVTIFEMIGDIKVPSGYIRRIRKLYYQEESKGDSK